MEDRASERGDLLCPWSFPGLLDERVDLRVPERPVIRRNIELGSVVGRTLPVPARNETGLQQAGLAAAPAEVVLSQTR